MADGSEQVRGGVAVVVGVACRNKYFGGIAEDLRFDKEQRKNMFSLTEDKTSKIYL
jgi:hypothetical protein